MQKNSESIQGQQGINSAIWSGTGSQRGFRGFALTFFSSAVSARILVVTATALWWDRMAAATPFGGAEVGEASMGLDVWLRK